MDKMNGKDTTQLIKVAKERLRWYTLEASETEYDEEEVEALVNLLSALEPVEDAEVQSDEVVLDRFHEYVKMRDAEEGIASKFSSTKKKYSGVTVFVKTHKIIVTAASILMLIIVAGGSLGAVNASKGNGFFYWLNRDEKGITMITSPENMGEGLTVEKEMEYASIEDVPEEYREYLVDLDEIDALREYDLMCIRVHLTESYFGIKRFFRDDSGKEEICVGVFVFSDKFRFTSEAYHGENVEISIGDEAKDNILIRENASGNIEYMMYFYKDNAKYYVEGNTTKDNLMEITEKYRGLIF